MSVEVDTAISGTVLPSWDHLVSEGRKAAGFQWKLGDLAAQVQIRYGESSLQGYAGTRAIPSATAIAKTLPTFT
jgi:hypothetical protein